jgi:hypothetical protein
MARKTRRVMFNADEQTFAQLAARAEADDRSLSGIVARAVKHYLSDTSYDDLALVILEAAERIRAQEGAL